MINSVYSIHLKSVFIALVLVASVANCKSDPTNDSMADPLQESVESTGGETSQSADEATIESTGEVHDGTSTQEAVESTSENVLETGAGEPVATIEEPDQTKSDTKVVNASDVRGSGSGLGVARPFIESDQVIYLFLESDDAAGLTGIKPADSLYFARGDFDIAAFGISERDGFKPLHTKLDYGIFYLRVVSRTREAIEVVVNEETGKTLWATYDSVDFKSWSEFLFDINSVERLNMNANPFRVSPSDASEKIPNPSARECLEVKRIMSDWMMVSSSEICGDIEVEDAWIRWWKDGQLLITYNLLS